MIQDEKPNDKLKKKLNYGLHHTQYDEVNQRQIESDIAIT